MKKITTLLLLALMTITASAAGKQLYFFGSVPGNGWTPNQFDNYVALDDAGDGINYTKTFTLTGTSYIIISDQAPCTDWDELNNSHRYTYAYEEKPYTHDYQLEILPKKDGNDPSIVLSAGTYTITVNSETMVMHLENAASPERTFYVVGNNADILGAAWDLGQENYMSETGTGTNVFQWKKDVTFNTMTPKTQDWKILEYNRSSAPTWSYQWGATGFQSARDGANINTDIPVSEPGVYTLTFELNLSNGIASVPTCTAVKKSDIGTIHSVYVNDQTGWGDNLKLYAYSTNSGPELFGNWGNMLGIVPETVVINGVTYKKYSFIANEYTYNLIFSNNGAEGDTRKTIDGILANMDYYITVSSDAAKVSVTTSKEYTTYVTPAPMDFSGLGVKAYAVTDATNKVTLGEVTTVPAGTPLVLQGTGTFAVPVVASADAPAKNLLKASTGIGTTVAVDEAYILSGGAFHPANAGTIPAGKAYLLASDVTLPAGAHSLDIDFGGTTGINMVNSEGLKVNGSEVYYDLQGHRVLYPTKGLYIVNGKKVIIK